MIPVKICVLNEEISEGRDKRTREPQSQVSNIYWVTRATISIDTSANAPAIAGRTRRQALNPVCSCEVQRDEEGRGVDKGLKI